MKIVLGAIGLFAALAATDASAQIVNLTGEYRCIQVCQGPGLAYVTQNGTSLNLLNEVGEPSRAWIDYPGHIWADNWHEGAVYSPDGFTIQFDRGTIWQRPALIVPPLRRRG